MVPVISVHNLKTQFGNTVIHDGLSLEIKRGEIIGIVGGSGTGKSVLINTILGLNHQVAGEIKVLGRTLGSIERIMQSQMPSHWGVLFQSGALFSSMTVGENIMVPMKEIAKIPDDMAADLAMVKLKMVGLKEADFNKRPEELSGGMVKRAALARALAIDPEILFLDEPTAGLDPISATAFDHLILSLRDSMGLTVVMVTHDLDSIMTICDRLAVLIDKKVIVGTIKEITQHDNPWIQSYFHGIRGRSLVSKSKKG